MNILCLINSVSLSSKTSYHCSREVNKPAAGSQNSKKTPKVKYHLSSANILSLKKYFWNFPVTFGLQKHFRFYGGLILNSYLSVIVFNRSSSPGFTFRVLHMLFFTIPALAVRGGGCRLTSGDQQTSSGCNYLARLWLHEVGEADIWFMLEWPS